MANQNLEAIKSAMSSGFITYEQMITIAKGLACFNKTSMTIQPGTQIINSDRASSYLSDCNQARVKAQVKPLTASSSKNAYFPSLHIPVIPIFCESCPVFAPALDQLSRLLER